jgi:serine/threonine-protein kinase
MIPQSIGRYEVIGLLGSGGSGQVYAARDTQLGRTVAIKALRPEHSTDPGSLARFHAEAANLGNLSHPNITTLYDLLPEGQQLYMIMELERGHTLETVLARCRRLGLREALAVVAQAAAALGYAHKKDVIHRDIKPSNLMLTENGLLKVMDFGIARVRGSQRLTREGSIVGTLFYVAPEQIKGGEGDEQSDVYSLGCVLYEMLSGAPPFRGNSDYDLIKAHVEARPPPLAERVPGLPAHVEHALMRALEKKPENRFASVEEFSRALGSDAIQGQATEIIRSNVLPLAGPIVSQASSPGGGRRSSANAAQSSRRSPDPPANPAPTDWTVAQGGSNRMPVIALAGAVTVLGLGLIYFLWGADLLFPPQPPQTRIAIAAKEPSPVPAKQPPPVPQSNAPGPTGHAEPPPRTPQPDSDMFVPTNELSKPSSGAQSSLIIGTPPVKPPQEPAPLPTKPPLVIATAPAEPPRELTLPKVPVLPAEKPAYQGKVANWMVADLLFVLAANGNGSRPLRLFGIISVDQTSSAAQAESHRKQLNEFITSVGSAVACYERGGGEYQCFADNQDIGLWAVKHGLARVANNAPAEYREANR